MILSEGGALFPHDWPLWDRACAVLMPHTNIWGRLIAVVDCA
jgi:hypothetical protein